MGRWEQGSKALWTANSLGLTQGVSIGQAGLSSYTVNVDDHPENIDDPR